MKNTGYALLVVSSLLIWLAIARVISAWIGSLCAILQTAIVVVLASRRMKALVKLLLVVFGLTASVRAQESSPTPNTVDEPALPNSKLEIPHPPSMALLPESGALPDPTPSPTSGIYSPLKTKKMVVTKPPLRPKRSRRWKPKRKSASRSSDRSPCETITESDDARLSAPRG